MTSERDKLIEAVMEAISPKARAEAALAVVYERLHEVTPAMIEAWDKSRPVAARDRASYVPARATVDWLAMLDASPLAEGQSAPVRKEGE